MEWIRTHQLSPGRARSRYVAYTALWFLLSLMLGTLIALAEYCAWLPCCVLLWFELPVTSHATILDIIGLALSQTIYIPLLFLAGLSNTTYYYTSRVLYLIFWFLHGVDIWKYLLALHQDLWRYGLSVIPMAAVFLCTGGLVLRVHLIATAGVRRNSSHYGMYPAAYFANMLQCWGGILILQMAFYGLYIRFS